MEETSKKRNIENATLPLDVVFLGLIREGVVYPAAIAKRLSQSRSSASRRLKNLECAGLVARSVRSSAVYYTLTAQGVNLLKASRRVFESATLKSVFRLHNVLFRLPILGVKPCVEELSKNGFVSRQRGFMRGFEVVIGGDRVFFVGNAFLVFPKAVAGESLTGVVDLSLKRVERVGKRLARLFPQVRLHYRSEVCREHLAMVGGVTRWFPEGYRFQGERLLIDFSTGVPELEAYGKFSFEGMERVARFLDRVAQGELDLPDASQRELRYYG